MSTVSDNDARINEPAAGWPEWTDAVHWRATADALAIPARPARPFSPSQAEAEAVAIAERCAASTAGLPAFTMTAFKCGAYLSLYRELYEHFADAQAELDRMKRDHYPFGALELPDASYYDSTDSDA